MKMNRKTGLLFLLSLFIINNDLIGQVIKPVKGQKAPELVFNNPEGKPIKLSSLKGKMVLVDFWASWCMPCRIANPHLVKMYNKHKNSKFISGENGFTIYSVSLDKANGKQRWINAIKRDGLIWDYHVSDLKGWASEAAKLYGVRSIPQTFLIDGKGILLGKFMNHRDVSIILDKRTKK